MHQAATMVMTNPFPGLRPFREDEEHLFFGRESQVDTMVDKLARTRFLAVVGTSGSGKSSLVNCGLRPALYRGLMASAGTSWRMAQFRPGSNPIRAMARALAKDGTLFRDFDSSGGLSLDEMLDATLRMSKLGLVDVYEQAQLPQGTNLLLVVDQFEELFRYRMAGASDQAQEAMAFVNLLLEPKTDARFPISIVLTMRSDFLGDCAEFSGLPEAINQGQYLVPRMTREERRAAISGPAAVGGADISPVLLTRLVNDVGDNPDQLSILQHALNRTWSRWQHEGRAQGPLDLDHYEAIGTMAGALDQHAEKAFAELANERQSILCEKIFKALTDKGTDARGIRRPTALGTLCSLADASQAEVTQVIDVFRKPSRSFLLPPQPDVLQPETIIDISHESLMRVWERLKTWSEEEAQSAHVYRRLSEIATLHAAGKAGLWRDPELQLALEWREKEQPTPAWAGLQKGNFDLAMAFLAESDAQRDREVQHKEERQKRELAQQQALAHAEEQARAARRFRNLGVAAAVLALMAIVAAGYAWEQQSYAKTETKNARKSEAKAEMETTNARISEAKAEMETARAKASEEEADTQRKEATRLKTLAEREGVKDRSRYLAQQALATLGQQRDVDPELGLILAREAANTTLTTEAQDALRRAVQDWALAERTIKDTGGAPRSIIFSPDSKSLAGIVSGKVILWDAQSGQPLPYRLDADNVTDFAFSPNGKYLVTVSGDTTVRLWEATTGTELRVSRLSSQGVLTAITFSPDGKYLATGSKDNVARLYSILSGELTDMKHDAAITTLAFAPDGKHIATATADHTAHLWDLAGKEVKAPGMPHQLPVAALAFSPDGKHLATISGTAGQTAVAGDSSTLSWWDLSSDLSVPVAFYNLGAISSISFSRDGSRFVFVSNGTVRIWDIARRASPLLLTGSLNNIQTVVVSPDGKRLATTSSDNRTRVWSAPAHAELFTLAGHEAGMNSIAFSPDGERVAAARSDNTIGIWSEWSALAGTALRRLKGHRDGIYRVAFSKDGRKLATASWDKTARIWDSASGKEMTLSGHTSGVMGVAFSPDGKRIATCSADRTAKVWDVSSGKLLLTLSKHTDLVMAVAFSPDGKRLATASWDKTAIVWDAYSGIELMTLKRHTDHVEDVAFSPDGKWLATASSDKTAKIWYASTGKERFTLSGHSNSVLGVAFSPDSKRLATASADRTAKLWDLALWKLIGLSSVISHQGRIRTVAFSPDGKRLATGSDDNLASVWDATSGVRLFSLSGHIGKILGIAFSPDGSKLVTAGADNIALVYGAGDEEIMKLARERTTRPLTARECDSYGVRSDECREKQRLEKDQFAAQNLVGDGEEQARHVDAKSALATVNNVIAVFKKAKQLNPDLKLDPEKDAKRFVAESLMMQGRDEAEKLEVKSATEAFRKAKELNPDLKLDAETEANRLVAQSLLTQGADRAQRGDVSAAVASFREAQQRDQRLKLDPEAEANRPTAEALLTSAGLLAKQDKVKDALAAYSDSIKVYERLPALDPEGKIRANAWNNLCWQGSLRGHAGEVMDACGRAVIMSKERNAAIRDSRGLARALTGNFGGAIDDFQFFIDQIDQTDQTKYPERKSQRQKWVEVLRAGKNPFTPEVLKQISDQ